MWAIGAVGALDLLVPQTCHPMLSVLACPLPAKDQFKFPVLWSMLLAGALRGVQSHN